MAVKTEASKTAHAHIHCCVQPQQKKYLHVYMPIKVKCTTFEFLSLFCHNHLTALTNAKDFNRLQTVLFLKNCG